MNLLQTMAGIFFGFMFLFSLAIAGYLTGFNRRLAEREAQRLTEGDEQ